MNSSQAKLELAIWQAESDLSSNSDIYARLTEMGLPPEAAIRLKELLEVVKPIGGKVISIGKIIVLKLIEFIEKHPNLAVGVALGAGISVLISAIPFLGAILAPISLALGIGIGAVVGHRIDKAQGAPIEGGIGLGGIVQDVIEIARIFFTLLSETLTAISSEFSK